MRLHFLVRKGVLGFALAGLVGSAAAQAQDKDAAKAQKDAAKDTDTGATEVIKHVKRNTKPANKTHKPKICPFCVPPLPNKWGDLDKSHLLNNERITPGRRGTKPFADSGYVHQILALIIPNDQRIEVVRPRYVASDHEFLPSIHAVFHPRAGSLSRFVQAVFMLTDHAFQLLLTHGRERIRWG